MKKLLETKECKEYIQTRNAVKFAEITLANVEMSGNPIAIEQAKQEYTKAQKNYETAKDALCKSILAYVDSST